MPRKKKKKARLGLERIDFETLVESKHKKAGDILDDINAGKIKKSDWLFTFEDIIEISSQVAIGFWHNCRTTENPKGKWNREYGRKQVTEIIDNAFTG